MSCADVCHDTKTDETLKLFLNDVAVDLPDISKYKFRENMNEDLHIKSFKMWILSLMDINSVKNNFTVRFECKIKWPIMRSEMQSFLDHYKKGKVEHWNPFFVPDPLFYNCSEKKEEAWMEFPTGSRYVLMIEDGEVCCEVCKLCAVTFQEQFEMNNFPFDVQYLKMTFQIRNERHFKNIYHQKGENFRIIWGDVMECHYLPGEVLPEWHLMKTAAWRYDGHRETRFVLVVKRNYGYYIRNVVFVVACILLLSLMVFFIADVADKLAHANTLLLAEVAYMFVIDVKKPCVSYSTIMDRYIVFAFLFVSAEIVIVSLCSAEATTLDAFNDDTYTTAHVLILVFMICAVVIHMLFAIYAYRAIKFELTKVDNFENGNAEMHGTGAFEVWSLKFDENGFPIKGSEKGVMKCENPAVNPTLNQATIPDANTRNPVLQPFVEVYRVG